MAWDDDIPMMIRALINDDPDAPLYDDDTLLRMILVQAMRLDIKLRFPAGYAVSLSNETIRPDPTSAASYDKAFVVLVSYASAVAIISAEVRDMTRQGIDVQDGDSRISLKRDPASLGLMLAAYKKDLDDLVYDYQTNGGVGVGEAIVGPYPIFRWGCGGGYVPHAGDEYWRRYC